MEYFWPYLGSFWIKRVKALIDDPTLKESFFISKEALSSCLKAGPKQSSPGVSGRGL